MATIRLVDGILVKISRISRFYEAESKITSVTIDVDSSSLTMDEAIAIFGKDNVSSITLLEDDKEIVTYEGYSLSNIYESIDSITKENYTSINLSREVANTKEDIDAIINAYKTRYAESAKAVDTEEEAVKPASGESIAEEIIAEGESSVTEDPIYASTDETTSEEVVEETVEE